MMFIKRINFALRTFIVAVVTVGSFFVIFSHLPNSKVYAADCGTISDPHTCDTTSGCYYDYPTGPCMVSSVTPPVVPVPIVIPASQCDVDRNLYNANLLTEPQGIPLTVKDFTTALITSLYTLVTGHSLSETAGCGQYFMSKIGAAGSGCAQTPNTTCDKMTNNISNNTASAGYIETPGAAIYSADFLNDTTGGSLLGLAYTLDSYATKQEIPVSLAYYTNTTLSKVPFLGTAMAQSTVTGNYSSFMISIFGAWQAMRNLAYAAIAVVLLYTGILIILRKRVSQQLVVSVQYALPRLVLGVVLITFSYPIGASLGTLGWILFNSGHDIANSLLSTMPDAGVIIMGIVGLMLSGLVTGGITILLAVIFAIVIFIMWIFTLIKAFSIYIKIVFSVITSPLEFALGVVPGSEDKIKDWFMRMAKYILTLFGMGIVTWFGFYLSLQILKGTVTEGNIGGVLLGTFLPLLVILYTFGLAVGMEGHIESFLGTGVKKKK